MPFNSKYNLSLRIKSNIQKAPIREKPLPRDSARANNKHRTSLTNVRSKVCHPARQQMSGDNVVSAQQLTVSSMKLVLGRKCRKTEKSQHFPKL